MPRHIIGAPTGSGHPEAYEGGNTESYCVLPVPLLLKQTMPQTLFYAKLSRPRHRGCSEGPGLDFRGLRQSRFDFPETPISLN